MRLAPGVVYDDEVPHGRKASSQFEVLVGRLHQDTIDSKQSWLMWVVADNVLKGASLNGLQIMEFLMKIRQGVQ